MQTITIEGKELLVPIGCPDLEIQDGWFPTNIRVVGYQCAAFRDGEDGHGEWNNSHRRVCACVASKWFERRAAQIAHGAKGARDKINKLEAAAEAWDELIDWRV
jgi:hypothetical protein